MSHSSTTKSISSSSSRQAYVDFSLPKSREEPVHSSVSSHIPSARVFSTSNNIKHTDIVGSHDNNSNPFSSHNGSDSIPKIGSRHLSSTSAEETRNGSLESSYVRSSEQTNSSRRNSLSSLDKREINLDLLDAENTKLLAKDGELYFYLTCVWCPSMRYTYHSCTYIAHDDVFYVYRSPFTWGIIVGRKTSHSLLECFSFHEHFVFMMINPPYRSPWLLLYVLHLLHWFINHYLLVIPFFEVVIQLSTNRNWKMKWPKSEEFSKGG